MTEQYLDHKDSHLYMMMRREINEGYAEIPVNFNAAGLLAGQKMAGRIFSHDDIIVDVGSNSGQMIAEAAIETGVQARIICVEPDDEAAQARSIMPPDVKNRTNFLQAVGEALPLATSSVEGLSLHNVIFRAQSASAMLAEVKRVVKPNGFIAISSNDRGHAPFRHEIERRVAEAVIRETNQPFKVPPPPAEGHYLQTLPSLFERVGGLAIRDDLYVAQRTRALITPGDRLENYLESIKFSAANTGIANAERRIWRRIVNTSVRAFIENRMATSATTDPKTYQKIGPFFADPIIRGMFVLQNQAPDTKQ